MRLPTLFLLLAGVAVAQPNKLTPKEAADGWLLLFDGETMFGWTEEGQAKWRVADGALVADAGQTGWLRSNPAFADYVFRCDFRIKKDGNSGVFIRSAKTGAPHETGYEVQIWEKNEKFPTGSLVNHIKAKKAKMKPDQWQTYEIQANGDRYIIKLDGKTILDGRDAKSQMGHFGFQSNKDKVEFRNVKVKPLNMKSLFDGKSLSGWHEVKAAKPPKEPPVWSAKDGMIHVEKGPGQLETDGTYGNFVLQLDVNANAPGPTRHPNSGVFFRGDPNGYWSGYESQIRNEYKDGDRTKPVDWGTGAIYNRVATRKVVTNDNEFFTKTIAAYGKHISVWLNGYLVTDWDDPRPDAPTVRQGARTAAGPFSLQAHDPTTNLDFKNIRVEVLP